MKVKATDKIIEVAKEIFADNHFEHATVKMICDKADVNIASVNYHFRSKKDLYLETLASIYEKIKVKEELIFDFDFKEKTEENWENMISEMTNRMITVPDDIEFSYWHKIIFRELNNPSEVYEEIYKLYLFPILEKIDLCFQNFFPEMEKKERLRWVLSLISQISFVQSAKSLVTQFIGADFYEADSLDEYSAHITRTICSSLKVKLENK